MIDSIRIRNIQSHKDTELDFCKGINVIIGSSNNGKTAILRSLYWSIYNRPLGIDNLCSHWALDEKGNIKDEMSVEVRKGDDVLIRRKTKNTNQYVLNGKELNAIKTDVPQEVKNFYKLNETNIQKQQDAPFLVSSSGGEVAKYFNGIAKLDVIDSILSYAEQSKRKERNSVESIEKMIEKQEELHESFSWTEKVGELLDKMDRLIEKVNTLDAERITLRESKEKFERYVKEMSALSVVERGKVYIEELEENQREQDQLSSRLNRLRSELSDYEKLKSILSIQLPVDKLQTYDDITTEIASIEKKLKTLKVSLADYEDYKETIEGNDKKVNDYKAKLPEICPLCGNPMKEEI